MKKSLLVDFLEKQSEKHSNKNSILFYEDTYTYSELNSLVSRFATGLFTNFGIKKGDVVAIQSSNSVEYVITLFACWRIGATLTPLNPALKSEEIHFQLENSEAKCFIYEGYIGDKAREAVKLLEKRVLQIVFNGTKLKDELEFTEVFESNSLLPKDEIISINEIGLIIYTSGTTGKPKGVMLTHSNIIEMVYMSISSLELTEEDRSFLILPLFHVNGIIFTLTSVLMVGGSAVIRKKFVLDEFLSCIEQYKPTFTSAVPTIYGMLANLPKNEENKYNLQSLRFGICGAAPVSLNLFERFESRYPFKLIEGWGLSEGTCATTLNPIDGKRKVGSIGRVLTGQQLQVVDEEGSEVPTGEKGELIIKGPNVMQGYLKRDDETKKTLKDGWLYTGDIGYKDEDGFFYIVDRKKDLIIRGGMNIYPKQIEEILYQIPEVLEAAVVGVPDELYGEEVLAYVVLREKATISEDDIIHYCQKRMANYRCPKKVIKLTELPKNAVGKITKGPLRDMATT
ncbi:class I adenylate-forming enzyme family protein [Bacillus sp. FJAT-45350]|uniref:class I adenylate-forming enzyme family protein n=1 Tax=Bacillus sp. FJAT-45350 TaxID=2011014 RepID=UPI000BB6DBA5|nr:long-chain-fatty-acid--CoA ligase [Bacillus sp. FJAT-45350]